MIDPFIEETSRLDAPSTVACMVLVRPSASTVPAAAAASIEPATPLLGTDLLDSLAVIQLMVFVGEAFGVTIEDEDFTPENLASVGSLIELVERKRTACA